MVEAEERLRGLQEELSGVENLLQVPGWDELMKIAQGQLQLRLPAVLTKTENVLEIVGKEFDKGVISGIELFCSLPAIRAEALKQDIAKAEEELGYGPGERRDDSGDDGGANDGEGTFSGDAPRV